MTTKLRRFVASLPMREIARDTCFLGGLIVAAYGISLWSFPAAVVFAGLCLSGLAYLTAPQQSE